MSHFNVDIAVESIKSIIDNTQCVTCDKLIGPCVRFPCGHTVCEGCAQSTGECLYCISSPSSYCIDKPQSIRLEHSAALLTSFQDTFNIDVYKRQRISDHLKAEKQVFPECIQAPNKYCNKRKSLAFNNSFKDKENISPNIFGAEANFNVVKMKKSAQYVQNWLNKHESTPQNLPRRPFGDINVNTQSLINKSKKDANLKKRNAKNASPNANKSTYRVRSHLKIKSPSLLNNVVKTDLEIKNIKQEINKDKIILGNKIVSKCDTNESGIVLDDEPIAIEDGSTNIIEKDEQAWMAVLAAAEKDEKVNKEKEKNYSLNVREADDSLLNVIMAGPTKDREKIDTRFPKNVLFYKKSSLLETCKLNFNSNKSNINSSPKINKTNDVSIVINSSAFVTTIKFTNCEGKNPIIEKTSTAIQTDPHTEQTDKINNINEKIIPLKRKNTTDSAHSIPKKSQKQGMQTHNDIQSLDVFATEEQTKQDAVENNSSKQRKCLIIEDSDTDSNLSCDNTHEVIVDVHRPNVPDNVECGILRTLTKMEYEHKTKRQARGHTPNSSNSSDKENLDPNRKKIVKLGKKRKNKK